MILRSGGEIHLFHALKHFFEPSYLKIPIITDLNPGPTYDVNAINENYRKIGTKILQDAFDRVKSLGIDETKILLKLEEFISPDDFVEKYAADKKVELVVVGCSGHHSKLRTVFLGTVAQKIMNKAPCDVLVVR
jgi:nucleotide-binding universal stress UspA family protein